jgi:hypothetical protein
MRNSPATVLRRVLPAILGLTALGLATFPVIPAAEAANPSPHKAIYRLSLEKTRDQSPITNVSGILEFSWEDVCRGWTTSQRTRMQMATRDGTVSDFIWSLNTLESKDGRNYRFFIRRSGLGGALEEVRGEAHLEEDGSGLAVFSLPEEHEMDLPKGTVFPSRHAFELIAATDAGKGTLWTVVFDGSGETGLSGISATVSKRFSSDDPRSFESPHLKGTSSSRVEMAYFSMNGPASLPEYEQGMRLYANGVADELLLDYGDFTLRGELESLDILPRPDC